MIFSRSKQNIFKTLVILFLWTDLVTDHVTLTQIQIIFPAKTSNKDAEVISGDDDRGKKCRNVSYKL